MIPSRAARAQLSRRASPSAGRTSASCNRIGWTLPQRGAVRPIWVMPLDDSLGWVPLGDALDRLGGPFGEPRGDGCVLRGLRCRGLALGTDHIGAELLDEFNSRLRSG